MSDKKRIAITGMAINTALGDKLDDFLDNLLQGRSAITRWKYLGSSSIYSRLGGDLSEYDIPAKVASLRSRIPEAVAQRLQNLVSRSLWTTTVSVLLAMDAFLDAGLFSSGADPERVAAVVCGHNLSGMHMYGNFRQFVEEPDHIDPLLALSNADSNHTGCVAEALDIMGPVYVAGGACASGNVALRCAMDEIRYHDMDMALVVGAIHDFCPMELHSLALMGATSAVAFKDNPALASRPFDLAREGCVCSHGGGALVLEAWKHALDREARIYGELVGVEVNSAAMRTARPSVENQVRVIERVLHNTGVDPGKIDFVSAHATSTPLGDPAEISALRRAFGDHAKKLKINAPKSMLGHTGRPSAVVETVAAVLQMRAGRLHPSINIERLDPAIDLDVCANRMVEHRVRYLLKPAFGFGGINSASIIRRYDG